MSAKLLAWIMLTWLTFAFSDWLVNNLVGSTSDIDVIFSIDAIKPKQFLGLPIPLPNIEYFNALWGLASWNWWFFRTEGTFWIRFFFGIPTIGIMTYYVYTLLLPVFINAVGAAGSVIRSVNPFSRG
ncbi:hypothetical protein LCGC14_2829180 [marine sediment metagenome]|uniref:Uncharacterized protein n=1 Tax=marine sediment metagenome TaxID=412755 RepID=A0A0F9AN49_9ZZZZ